MQDQNARAWFRCVTKSCVYSLWTVSLLCLSSCLRTSGDLSTKKNDTAIVYLKEITLRDRSPLEIERGEGLPNTGELIVTPYDIRLQRAVDPVVFELPYSGDFKVTVTPGAWRFYFQSQGSERQYRGVSKELQVDRGGVYELPVILGRALCLGVLSASPSGSPEPDLSLDLPAGSLGLAIAELPNGLILLTGGATVQEGGLISALHDQLALFNPYDGLVYPTAETLSAPRAYHRAEMLDDGRILISGGYSEVADGELVPSAIIELIELDADGQLNVTVLDGEDDREARVFHGTTKLKDRSILISGGIGLNGEILRSTARFFPDTNTLIQQPEMLKARAHHQVVSLDSSNELALVIGGYSDDGPTSTTEMFLAASHPLCEDNESCFSKGVELSEPRWAHSVVKSDVRYNTAIIAGGYSSGLLSDPQSLAAQIEVLSIEKKRVND